MILINISVQTLAPLIDPANLSPLHLIHQTTQSIHDVSTRQLSIMTDKSTECSQDSHDR